MRIKNWEELQHFKDRTPPWIKLYKKLIDNPDWHELSGDDSKVLVMLWLLASEDKDMEGNLPCLKTIAFRLRIKEDKLKQSLTNLSDWLIQDDINMISNVYHLDAPETEKRQRREETYCVDNFHKFWNLYPNKKSKSNAIKAFKKLKVDDPLLTEIMLGLELAIKSPDWMKNNGQFIPHPATWLNGRRWEDEYETSLPEQPDFLKDVI